MTRLDAQLIGRRKTRSRKPGVSCSGVNFTAFMRSPLIAIIFLVTRMTKKNLKKMQNRYTQIIYI